jgi:hypothetical protein
MLLLLWQDRAGHDTDTENREEKDGCRPGKKAFVVDAT